MGKADRHEPPASDVARKRVRGVSKNSAEARRKILDAAMEIFGKQGFARTKTEDVAEHAGYGQATVFFHFKTKAGLLEACMEEALARAKAGLVLAQGSGTIDLMSRLDRAFDNSVTADLFARMLAEFGEESTMRSVYGDFHEHVRQLIAAELLGETGVGERGAYLAAAAILSMMIGVHAEHRLESQRLSRTDYREMLIRVTRLVLQDLERSPGG